MTSGPENVAQFPFADWEIEDSLPGRFARVAAAFPDLLAWRTAAGHSLTYAELDLAANRIAQALLDRLGPGEARVAFMIEHEGPQIPVILGVLKAGMVYVPLDPDQTLARNRFILEDTETGLIIADARYQSLAFESAAGCPVLRMEEIAAAPADADPDLSISPDALSCIYYTTGSTGEPKGVVHSHRSNLHALRATGQIYGLRPGERMANLTSSAFMFSSSSTLSPLLFGTATVCFDVRARGLKALAAWLEAEEIAVFTMVPSLFRQFAAALPAGSCPGVRLIVSGGEAVLPEDVRLLREHFSPGCQMLVQYSGTETRVLAHLLVTAETMLPEDVLPVGYPCPGKEIMILDEVGRRLPLGETGEIAVRSRYLSPGYWRRPDLTATAFQASPEGGSERLYRTGDLGRFRPDGVLVYLGRKDSMVKIKGRRVELGEIEGALRRLPGVREAAVLARPNPRGELVLVAYVVSAGEGGSGPGDWRPALASALADYLLPAHFVLLPSLPLNQNGKLDRLALPDPDWRRREPSPDYLAPRNEIEARIAGVFERVLGAGPIGARDAFAALGGDSLAFLWLAVEFEREFGRDLPSPPLAAAVTVESLAAWLEEAAGRETQKGEADFLPGSEEAWALRLRGIVGPLAALLPYGRLVKLLRWLSGPVGQRLLFAQARKSFLEFTRELGREDRDGEALRIFLTANAGKKMFGVLLSRAGEAEYTRAVRVEGVERFREAQRAGKGVILVTAHFGVAGVIPLALDRLGVKDLLLVGKWSSNLVLMGLEHVSRNSLAGTIRSDALFTAQLLRGREVLARGGVFEILGDGHEGRSWEQILPFLGKQRHFKTGFAELAVSTGAPVLPVDVSLRSNGTILVAFHPPLRPEGAGRPEQVQSLVQGFAHFLEKRWRDDPANVYWRSIRGYNRLPERPDRLG